MKTVEGNKDDLFFITSYKDSTMRICSFNITWSRHSFFFIFWVMVWIVEVSLRGNCQHSRMHTQLWLGKVAPSRRFSNHHLEVSYNTTFISSKTRKLHSVALSKTPKTTTSKYFYHFGSLFNRRLSEFWQESWYVGVMNTFISFLQNNLA